MPRTRLVSASAGSKLSCNVHATHAVFAKSGESDLWDRSEPPTPTYRLRHPLSRMRPSAQSTRCSFWLWARDAAGAPALGGLGETARGAPLLSKLIATLHRPDLLFRPKFGQPRNRLPALEPRFAVFSTSVDPQSGHLLVKTDIYSTHVFIV